MSARRRRRPPAAPVPRGLTLDTGALVAFERFDRSLMARLKEALDSGRLMTLPTVVVAEAWRGAKRSARMAALVQTCVVEALGEALARSAGELQADVRGATPIDAVVAASAGQRGDVILTADVEDLEALAARLTGVAVVGV